QESSSDDSDLKTYTIPKLTSVTPTPIKRLFKDLKDLAQSDDALPGITVFPNLENMRKICLILTPVTGPFVGYRLHFKVHIPLDYPTAPPTVEVDIYLNHPNVYGDWICCSILRDEVEKFEDGFISGYSPAYTLKTFFLQILMFFSNEYVEQDYFGHKYKIADTDYMIQPKVKTIVKKMSYRQRRKRNHWEFICQCCGYNKGYSSCWKKNGKIDDLPFGVIWGPFNESTEQVSSNLEVKNNASEQAFNGLEVNNNISEPAKSVNIDVLPDDILFEISKYLSDQEINKLSK
ncbi:hypothetical protein HDU92_000768, partial [Lobulomyces angularis]